MSKGDYLERSIRNKAGHFTRANIFVEFANNSEQNLSNTLFLIATIFLGLSSPLVSDIEIISGFAKGILFFSWVLTIFSIFFGLWQLLINIRFFEKSYKLFNKLEDLWSALPSKFVEYNKTLEKSEKLYKDYEFQTTFRPLILQAGCMIVAIILAVIVGVLSLLKSSAFESDNRFFDGCHRNQIYVERHVILRNR